jgi:alpha-glucosidase
MLGDKAGDLLESNLLENLNPPRAIRDASWIKPGVSLWDWRANGAKAGDFTYGINQQSYLRFVDFAAEKGIEYVLFDAGWYNTTGPTISRDGMDMPGLIKYAESKGVGIFLYIDRKRKAGINDWVLEDVLKVWQQWGVKGIKYGFLGGECKGRQALVKKTREIVELCAKYRMMVDFHDHPVPPGGDSRTWPNLITREYCHSQSDARKAFGPKTFVTSALVNGVAGSLDMDNGYFELNSLMGRTAIGEPVQSTVVAEAARAFIIFSGLVVLPDHPDAYRAKGDLFNFIAHINGCWDKTKVLDAKIGEYLVVARKKRDTWLVGAATNEVARELDIPLDFLDAGEYIATIYSDDANTSAFGNKETYTISKEIISKGQVHHLKMAPGGGHAIILSKKENVQ